MTEAIQVSIIMAIASVAVATIQKLGHRKHERVSADTNRQVKKLNGGLKDEVTKIVDERMHHFWAATKK